MSLFQGDFPYGTAGGIEDPLIPTDPPLIRTANGRSVVLFMRVNGPITDKIRTQIEDIVRILDPSGTIIPPVGGLTISVLDNTVLIDENVQQIDFGAAIEITGLPSNQVLIKIPNGAISGLLMPGNVATTVKILNEAVTTGKLAPLSVDTVAFAAGVVTPVKLDTAYFEQANVPAANPAIISGRQFLDISDLAAISTGNIVFTGATIVIPNNGIVYDVVCQQELWLGRTAGDNFFAYLAGIQNATSGVYVAQAYSFNSAAVGNMGEINWIHGNNTWVNVSEETRLMNQTNVSLRPAVNINDWSAATSMFVGGATATITAYPRVKA